MLFSSLIFLFGFLPVVLGGYYLLPRKVRTAFLLAVNLFFYAYGEPVFVLLMVFSILLNWLGGLWIARCQTSGGRKAAMGITVAVNLLLLVFFKYMGLLGETLRTVLPFCEVPVLEIPLPIGISFYTFQSMSYVIDVYRGSCEAQRNVVTFGTYVSLFPQLIAGPIVRYRDVMDELQNDRRESAALFSEGASLFLVGLSKKVLLANPMGSLWESLSAEAGFGGGVGALGAWAGAVAFSLQIYFDFSGYSDMARGLGLMFGFHFCENFRYPFTASTVSDFWRRWHISLTDWFRDYVYIPLGGNRRGKGRTLLNLTIVWCLTGLWHGASWNFALWGLYYAVLLILERLFLGELLKKLPSAVSHLYTLFCVLIGWVLFAVGDASDLLAYLRTMFAGGAASLPTLVRIADSLPLMAAGCVACLPVGRELWQKLPKKVSAVLSPVFCLLALVLCTAALIRDSYNPFLYFRF